MDEQKISHTGVDQRPKELKFLFRSSIVLIILCFLPILGPLLPLEITDSHVKIQICFARVIILPIAILMTLTGRLKKNDSRGLIARKVIMTICLAFLSAFVMVIAVFANLCAWTNDEILYQNKENSSVKIIQRSFGCGATDSSEGTVDIFKVRELSSVFIWATKIDTAEIDKSEWTQKSFNN
jgi:hypothetical protein